MINLQLYAGRSQQRIISQKKFIPTLKDRNLTQRIPTLFALGSPIMASSVLRQLARPEREAIHAYYVEGKAIADISHSLHCTENAFEDLLLRTRRKVFGILGSLPPGRIPERKTILCRRRVLLDSP